MTGDRDILARADFHRERFGVTPTVALERATRELDRSDFWTPWEILGSLYVEDQLALYFQRACVTVQ